MLNIKALIGLAGLSVRVHAFWRLPCGSPVVVERSDPIVSPNSVSGHVHTVMGANSFNYTMEGDFTSRATCNTCKVKEDRSNYWFPNLYYHAENGSFIPVKQVGGAVIYYLQHTDENDPEFSQGLIAFPDGFRMLAGNPQLRSYNDTLEQRAMGFACIGTNTATTPEMPKINCPGGFQMRVTFPSCWNGQDLDSPNHKSHMSYPSGVDLGYCPPTHPKRFITVFAEITYDTDAFRDMWYGSDQPFVLSNGDPTGYGLHGDFVNGWESDVLQTAITECTDNSGNIEYCTAFTLIPDTDMNRCRKLPHIREQVLEGVLPALPGCNSVFAGPENAPIETGCGAPTTVPADPILPFTDVKAALGWRYLTCALDGNGLPTRTLTGPGLAGSDITVDKCVAFCKERGYRYAGVEYAGECYCGDSVDSDRFPADGLGHLAPCNMACTGDSEQICGGYGQIGIYENCTLVDGACDNMAVPQW